MSAELGTMRVTEQVDALSAHGANPIYYLVVPRFLACLLFIPLFTLMADFMGVVGGSFFSTQLHMSIRSPTGNMGAIRRECRPLFRRL